MKQGNQKSKAKIKSMKVPLKYQGQNSFKQTIDGAIEKVSKIGKQQSPLGKLDFKAFSNINTFKNPPLPSSPKSKNNPAKRLKKCHNLVSSTPYCDNKNKMSIRSYLLESPEGSPIQLDADEKVLKTSNLRQLEGNEGLEGSSSVVYVGTERGNPDETLKQIATATSPTKNAVKLISGISLERKLVSVKNNRLRSTHCDASPSAQSTENDPNIGTVDSYKGRRGRPRKKKRNETDLNDDEQAVISTLASMREISIPLPRLNGTMSDSDKVEHICSTSLSSSRKNGETHTTVYQARTRSQKRNESMTVFNGPPTPTKKTKDMQTSMEPVNFNGATFASAEKSDTCPTSARKNGAKSVVSRKSRNRNKTNFNGDAENSDAKTQNKSIQVEEVTLKQTKVTKDAQTSTKLVKLAGSTNTVKLTTSNNESPKFDIIEEIRQRKAQKLLNTTEVQYSSTSHMASRRMGLDRVSSARTVNRDWTSVYTEHMNAKKKRFDDLLSYLTLFAENTHEHELQEIRELEGGLKDSSSQWSSSNSHARSSSNSQASSNSSNRRFSIPNRISPYVNSCDVMNRRTGVSKIFRNKSLNEREQTIETVVSKLKDRFTEHKGMQTSTNKETHSRAPLFLRSAIKAKNMRDQHTTIVNTVSHQNSIGPNIYDSVKEGNPGDCLSFSALKDDGLVENQDKPWRFSHSRKSVLAGENITVPSFIRPESQIESNNESWLSSTFHKPANNKGNIKDKSLQNNKRLSKQVLKYSSDEDSEVMNRLLPKNHTLVQGESKVNKRRTYARTRQLTTQNIIITSITPTKANQSREILEKNRVKTKKVDMSKSGVKVLRHSQNQLATKTKQANKYLPTQQQPAESNSSKLQQSMQDDIGRESLDCQELASEVSEEAGPSRHSIPMKNKSLLVESGIEQLSQSPARSKRPTKYFPTPEQPAASNSSELQQSMQDDIGRESLDCQELASEVSEEAEPSRHSIPIKNKSLLVESGIEQLSQSPARNKRPTKYFPTSEQPAASNSSELQQSMQDDVALENLACVEQDTSEVSEGTGPSCHPKTKKNKSLLDESGTKQLPKSPTKNAANPISASNQTAISNYTQQKETNDVGCELSRLENPVTQVNYNTNGSSTANVEDTNCKFTVPPKESIKKRKPKSKNTSTNATSQLSELSTRDIRMDEPSTSKRKTSRNERSTAGSSFIALHPLASVNIANIIPSEVGTRPVRKRTCRNDAITQFIKDFEGDTRRLVFVKPINLAISKSSKKRTSLKGNNKTKSTSMLRKTDLSVIDEREVDNGQSGPSSSCLMPPPPVRISTTQHAKLQEITADSGFENSNSKTLQGQENTAKRPKSKPSNLNDDISQPGVLDQEEPVPPTLDDPDINEDLTRSSVIQPPSNGVPIQKEMTEFSGKQPPWKAYKQLGNLYLYESENSPDGSIGYMRLKPRTEAKGREPHHHMTFFVIKGTGRVQLENHSCVAKLGSGGYCYIPKGRNYTISNPSRCHLVITYKKH